ncbi:hypothetical protein V3409_30055, partial [Pseudomonas aeruginosa]|uniref:hypothetical protein n=1 Tax=Pseudomonas aeruginosa TaxID=287 RepID=UPI002F41631C
DGNNGFIMTYEAGSDIMATRVDSAGNFVWTPNHKPVCNHSSIQSSPYTIQSGNFLYTVWKDNRPPASLADIYVQKVNMNGEAMWNPTGRRVFNINSFTPFPKLVANSHGDLVVTTSGTTVGFAGQKIRPDSTIAWPGYGMQIATGNDVVPTNA